MFSFDIFPNFVKTKKGMAKYPEIEIKVPKFCEAEGFYTTKDRSALMSKIKGKNTKPEVKLRKTLWHAGIRYRKNVRKIQGTPDIVIRKYKLLIFVDGEFWHGHDWDNKKEKIKTNRDFWIPKIERNMQRDRINNQLLQAQGWTVFRFWEHQIKNEFGACINQILEYIESYKHNP